MNKHKILLKLVVVLWVCWPSYSYSDTAYGVSGNAATDGLSWVMTNVLPNYTGLAVNGVVYQYTTVKNPEDEMLVSVYNETADGNGYIFRNADDWSGQPSNTIRRLVPVAYVPREEWGNGGIDIQGNGQVVDPTVIYTYRYDDTCVLDPQTKPSCPGYSRPEIPEQGEYETQAYDAIQDEMDRQQTFQDEDQERQDFERMKDKEKKKLKLQELEALLGTLILNDIQGPSEILHSQLISLNYLSPVYERSIPDPGYEETIVLEDAELPDNSRIRRNFAQDQLHQQMVNSQYEE
jgi:hypothetical protein